MITHSIEIHTCKPTRKNFEKYEYALFIRNLPFAVGDTIVSIWWAEAGKHPPGPEHYYVVEEIQEICWLADIGEKEPRCLLVKSPSGTTFWTEPHRWRKVTDAEKTTYDITLC